MIKSASVQGVSRESEYPPAEVMYGGYSDLFSARKNTNLIIKGLTLDKQYGKHADSLERLPVNGTYL
jgi:hypothetical protein